MVSINNRKSNFKIWLSTGLLVAIMLLLAAAFFNLTIKLHQGVLHGLDQVITEKIIGIRSSSLTQMMIFITNLGSAPAYFIMVAVIFVLLFRTTHRWKVPVQTAFILSSSFALNWILKLYFQRIRPHENLRLVDLYDGSFSYPSGHSMTAMAFYSFLIYLGVRHFSNKVYITALIIGCLIMISVIGFSRIYLGAHYPSDVLAGYLAGLVWALLVISLMKVLKKRWI